MFSRIISKSLLLLVLSGGGALAIEVNSANGNCNVQLNNSNVQTIIGCPAKAPEPARSIGISYYWLNSRIASLLVANRLDAGLADVFGKSPVVLNTEPYQTFRDLIAKFGTTVLNSGFQGTYFTTELAESTGSEKTLAKMSFPKPVEGVPTGLKRSNIGSAKIYDAEETLYWPDPKADEQMWKTNRLPSDFQHYFADGISGESIDIEALLKSNKINDEQSIALGHSIATNLVLWRAISQREIESFNALTETYAKGAQSNKPSATPERKIRLKQKEAATELARKRIVEMTSSRAFRSIQFLTKNGETPSSENFLRLFGIFDGSHSEPEWTTMSIPPQLYLRVAVVENLAATPVNYLLKSFAVQISESNNLRPISDDERSVVSVLPFPPTLFAHGQKIVIPLGVDFRQSAEFGPEYQRTNLSPSNGAKKFVSDALKKIPTNSVQLGQVGDHKSEKSKEALDGDVNAPTRMEFSFGPALKLISASIDDKDVAFRAPLPRGLYTRAGLEGGSCPTLYIKARSDAELTKVGVILARSNGKASISTERVQLPGNLSDVVLVEQEPELTTIKRLRLVAHYKNGRSRQVFRTTAETLLHHGQFKWLSLKSFRSVQRYELEVRGYYQRYSHLLAARQP